MMVLVCRANEGLDVSNKHIINMNVTGIDDDEINDGDESLC